MEETTSCSVVSSSRFATSLADKSGADGYWKSTRRDADEPDVRVFYAVTKPGVRPAESVSPGGWKWVPFLKG